ncbi:hypothetical protein [Spongiactinospora rosea]|nr:hypothetical protein [Spongiactinospora rosea]
MLRNTLATLALTAATLVAPAAAPAQATAPAVAKTVSTTLSCATEAQQCRWRWWKNRWCRFCKRHGKWVRVECRRHR